MTDQVRRVWVTGANGQLGTELARSAPAGVEVTATDRVVVDIGDRARVLDFAGQTRPDLIINAAAYTAVDKAESESDLAFRINSDGARHLAEAARGCGARLIQVSTDYVFDGLQPTPYKPDDAANPVNRYGESKLAGERAVLQVSEGAALVVRTAWIYGPTGSNFVKTMLRLLRERREVRVVYDQLGTPTHAQGLASALWCFAARPDLRGIYHWTDAGVASWYDFAVAIRDWLGDSGAENVATVRPIPSADYPTPARRPACAVLDKQSTWKELGPAAHWRAELYRALERFSATSASSSAG